MASKLAHPFFCKACGTESRPRSSLTRLASSFFQSVCTITQHLNTFKGYVHVNKGDDDVEETQAPPLCIYAVTWKAELVVVTYCTAPPRLCFLLRLANSTELELSMSVSTQAYALYQCAQIICSLTEGTMYCIISAITTLTASTQPTQKIVCKLFFSIAVVGVFT